MSEAEDKKGGFLSDIFNLKSIAKFALISVPLFVVLGGVDLMIWHYMPGGMELFHTVFEPLLDNPVVKGISNVFSAAASALGGGNEVIAEQIGATIDPGSGGIIYD